MAPDPNSVLSKEEVAELCSTELGRAQPFDWLLAQHIAGGLAAIFSELGLVIPGADEQMKACAFMFYFRRRKSVEEVMDELNLAYRLIAQGIQPQANEDLMAMRPMGEA